jgi:nucleoid DNA-binding protein
LRIDDHHETRRPDTQDRRILDAIAEATVRIGGRNGETLDDQHDSTEGNRMKKTRKAKTTKGKKAKAGAPAQRAITKLDLKKPVKVAASQKPRSKSEVFQIIGQHVGCSRRDVAAMFHTLGGIIKADLSKMGAGVASIPGLLRITVKRKPATPARMGINPFTKEQVMFKAKPARNVVKVRPLRGLKDMVP